MALYRYVKKIRTKRHKVLSYVSYSLIVLGALFLFWSFYPVVSYEIYSYLFIRNNFFSPVPRNEGSMAHAKAQSIMNDRNVFSTNLVDYTKATTWFPKLEGDKVAPATVLTTKEYTLSIPKLDIDEGKVVVGGEDLASALVQYQPKVLPGENGVSSIFGHSTHPSLYSKTGEQRYKSIFTYLPTLNNGDEIIITVNGVAYTYSVFNKFEVMPDEVDVLNQKYDASYVNLITCVPVGQTARRLIIQARLKELIQ